MFKLIPIFVITITLTNTCYSEETSQATTIQIYRVGDLVSRKAVNTRFASGKISAKEWQSEYSQTLDALTELQGVVEVMCSHKPISVKAYSPSLSLIVRHTKDGHTEISQLLQALRKDAPIAMRLECRSLSAEFNSEGLSDAQKNRLEILLTKTSFTKDETAELLKLVPKPILKHNVALRAGHRTSWGDLGRPCTAMGRIDTSKNVAQIRIDYITDDITETTLFGSQVLSLADGESALFYHNCDGATIVWLVTADLVDNKKLQTVTSK